MRSKKPALVGSKMTRKNPMTPPTHPHFQKPKMRKKRKLDVRRRTPWATGFGRSS
jgi:hypothetical protein